MANTFNRPLRVAVYAFFFFTELLLAFQLAIRTNGYDWLVGA